MDSKNLLKKYHVRLVREGWLKSLMCGLVVGFSALMITAAVCWYVGFKGLWLYFLVLAVVTGITTPIFYFKVYRSTVKRTARRLDALGLEERLLTMTEMENDDSYIARRQREDAAAALNTVNQKLLKFVVSTSLIVTLSIVGVCGIGMTTYASVSKVSGRELFAARPAEYRITYQITGQGQLIGDVIPIKSKDDGKITGYYQLVGENQAPLPVLADPAAEWVFAGWSDGYGNPYRVDSAITEDMTLYAVFEPMDALDDEEDPKDTDSPNTDLSSGNRPGPGPGGDGPGGGDLDESASMVIDGKTNYGGSTYDNAYDQAMEDLGGNDDISEDGKGVITDYLDTIAK